MVWFSFEDKDERYLLTHWCTLRNTSEYLRADRTTWLLEVTMMITYLCRLNRWCRTCAVLRCTAAVIAAAATALNISPTTPRYTRRGAFYSLSCTTSWLNLNDGSSPPHECRLHYLLERPIICIILTAMNCYGGIE